MGAGRVILTSNVFAMDYDYTIAEGEFGYIIHQDVKRRLHFCKNCKLILATGRKFEDIPDRDVTTLFDVILSENGTILHTNGGKDKRSLVDIGWIPDMQKIKSLLNFEKINYFSGEVILACLSKDIEPLREVLIDGKMINKVDIELNKRGALIMPLNWNKGRGVRIAHEYLGGGKLIAFGDDLNDLSLFDVANYRVAVKNAVPELKKRADLICDKDNGQGVVEVIENICRSSEQ